MIERVYIETTASQEKVQAALADNGITVNYPVTDGEPRGYPRTLTADVPDSRDAVEEVTNALDKAGIAAYVYSDD